MRENLRKSGIDIIGDVPWGMHFCQFYQTKEDLMDILVPYFKAGLENNEFCMWIVSQLLEVEDAKEALRRNIPDFDTYLENGQIEIIPYSHGYINEGISDSERVLNGWVEKINQALENGYDGLRLTENTFWLEKKDWSYFADYEEKLDSIIGNYQMMALCTYSLDRCNATEIIEVVINHQFALIKREGKWEQIESSKRKKAEGQEPIPHQALLDENRALQDEVQSLRARLAEAEELRRAISEGDLDALVIPGPEGEMIFTLNSADHAYRVLVETMNEGTATLTYDGTILYCNRRFAELLRMPLQDIVGTSIYRFIVPENAIAFKALLKREKGMGEINLRAEGGISLPVYMSISSLHTEGSPNAWCIVITDLNELKKAEEKIQNLANIVEYSNDAIITKSLGGIITSWNKGAEQIYGYSAEEVVGKPISILEPSILFEETEELAELIKQGDKIHNYETLRLRKDGTIINVSLTLSQVFDASGKLTDISVIARDITKSKKAEEKIRKSEERYRIVTEQTGQVVYDYDSRTDKGSWAGAIEEVTGYSFKELKKFNKDFWIKNIHRADMNNVDEKFKNVRNIGGQFKEELRLRRKDGTCIYIENSGVCLTDHEGLPYGAIGVLKDITSTKLAEIQLQENENRYRIATEQTGQVIFDFNLETCELRLSGAILEVTGYGPEELENLDKSVWIEHVHPEDRMELIENLMKSFEEEKKFQVEFRFRKKDGNYIYAENYGVWLKDDKGKVYRVIGVIKNITEWKLAIENVAESERKYRSFIQNFHGIAFQLDENFVPVFLNGAVEEITGYSEEDFMSWIKWKDIIPPDDLSLVLKEEEKIRSSPSTGYEEIEFRIKHRDGRIRWVNEIYQKIQGKDGKPEFYQGTIYDVTERKETEKFLANIETARKKEIHHRIKNNLQVISSLLDLQAEKFNSRECVKDSEVLAAFRESQDRVISMALIHEELYKGGGLDTLNFSSYVKELAKNLFQTYRLGNASTSLNMNLEENIFLDMDTAVPLGIIINELVSNSLKHAFADRDYGIIQITLCREASPESKNNRAGNNNEGLKGTSFILTVSDNGIGVPESFDLENPESLGIQLVTTLVDQLEGELELDRDNGTEFTTRFTVV